MQSIIVHVCVFLFDHRLNILTANDNIIPFCQITIVLVAICYQSL